MKRSAVFAVLVLQLGCFHGRVVSGVRSGPVERELGFSLLWGLTQTKTTAIECRNGLASAGSYLPWWGGFLWGLTAGLVMPVVKEYACNHEAPVAAAR